MGCAISIIESLGNEFLFYLPSLLAKPSESPNSPAFVHNRVLYKMDTLTAPRDLNKRKTEGDSNKISKRVKHAAGNTLEGLPLEILQQILGPFLAADQVNICWEKPSCEAAEGALKYCFNTRPLAASRTLRKASMTLLESNVFVHVTYNGPEYLSPCKLVPLADQSAYKDRLEEASQATVSISADSATHLNICCRSHFVTARCFSVYVAHVAAEQIICVPNQELSLTLRVTAQPTRPVKTIERPSLLYRIEQALMLLELPGNVLELSNEWPRAKTKSTQPQPEVSIFKEKHHQGEDCTERSLKERFQHSLRLPHFTKNRLEHLLYLENTGPLWRYLCNTSAVYYDFTGKLHGLLYSFQSPDDSAIQGDFDAYKDEITIMSYATLCTALSLNKLQDTTWDFGDEKCLSNGICPCEYLRKRGLECLDEITYTRDPWIPPSLLARLRHMATFLHYGEESWDSLAKIRRFMQKLNNLRAGVDRKDDSQVNDVLANINNDIRVAGALIERLRLAERENSPSWVSDDGVDVTDALDKRLDKLEDGTSGGISLSEALKELDEDDEVPYDDSFSSTLEHYWSIGTRPIFVRLEVSAPRNWHDCNREDAFCAGEEYIPHT